MRNQLSRYEHLLYLIFIYVPLLLQANFSFTVGPSVGTHSMFS